MVLDLLPEMDAFAASWRDPLFRLALPSFGVLWTISCRRCGWSGGLPPRPVHYISSTSFALLVPWVRSRGEVRVAQDRPIFPVPRPIPTRCRRTTVPASSRPVGSVPLAKPPAVPTRPPLRGSIPLPLWPGLRLRAFASTRRSPSDLDGWFSGAGTRGGSRLDRCVLREVDPSRVVCGHDSLDVEPVCEKRPFPFFPKNRCTRWSE